MVNALIAVIAVLFNVCNSNWVLATTPWFTSVYTE